MAAPSATARVTPTGRKLEDGYQSLITFKRKPGINLWEKTVKPPGIDAGDSISQTTMHNSVWRTKRPRSLLDLTDGEITCAYDPKVYTEILTVVGINDEITVKFRDGSTLAFWGSLKSFIPDGQSEGAQPEATCVIVPSNLDNAGVEQAPVMTEVAGT